MKFSDRQIEIIKKEIVLHLDQLKQLFIPGMKLTFIASCPGYPEMEMVVTNAETNDLIETLNRTKSREMKGV